MKDILIAYWTGSGATEAMANAIADTIERRGGGVEIKFVTQITAAEALKYDILLLGCPAMGDEVLEESEFAPFYAELEPMLSGKTIGLFGSYDWGDGEWMRNWEQSAKDAGANVLGKLICQQDTDCKNDCSKFAKLFI